MLWGVVRCTNNGSRELNKTVLSSEGERETGCHPAFYRSCWEYTGQVLPMHLIELGDTYGCCREGNTYTDTTQALRPGQGAVTLPPFKVRDHKGPNKYQLKSF